ncbi:hypothetical protein [Crossiella cryophila]|uniref:Uncharacterized protein n=1 Tax=Crossiella cryophila TaxID=43355 RepID=A0A7W7CMN6_9PSEU|nr:hypothetical protein [Crossiella cryophila]MBB4682234.1 hypothetical protein [Crossiella cryophila]
MLLPDPDAADGIRSTPVTAHRIELRRIEQDRRSGAFPEPLAERPVAFGIFHARDERGRSCYLFALYLVH